MTSAELERRPAMADEPHVRSAAAARRPDLVELGSVMDGGPKRDDVAETPRGADRYSIVAEPRRTQNLGLVRRDGGAVQATEPAITPAFPKQPAVEDDVPGETSHEGPPSAADPKTWAGTTPWSER